MLDKNCNLCLISPVSIKDKTVPLIIDTKAVICLIMNIKDI